MKYVPPAEMTSNDVVEFLNRSDLSPSERIEAVLSAIFHADDTELAGDILIREFSECAYSQKIGLTNLFQTFYQMRGTYYRIDDSIAMLEDYRKSDPQHASEIAYTIETIRELGDIFRRQ